MSSRCMLHAASINPSTSPTPQSHIISYHPISFLKMSSHNIMLIWKTMVNPKNKTSPAPWVFYTLGSWSPKIRFVNLSQASRYYPNRGHPALRAKWCQADGNGSAEWSQLKGLEHDRLPHRKPQSFRPTDFLWQKISGGTLCHLKRGPTMRIHFFGISEHSGTICWILFSGHNNFEPWWATFQEKHTWKRSENHIMMVNPSDESCRRITNPNVAFRCFFRGFCFDVVPIGPPLVPHWDLNITTDCIRWTLEVLSNAWVSIRLHSPSASRKALDSSPLLSGYNQTTERSFGWFRSTWVCLKMRYTPNYSHLVGVMIINHWV